MSRRCWSGAILGLVIAGALVRGVSAEIVHVPKDYSTIQTAINFSTKGDEIIVAPGIYNEEINFLGQGIYLHSSGGAEVTTITSEKQFAAIVTCASGEGPDTILEGFTITGGFRGMRNFNTSSPTVRKCVFSNNCRFGIDTDDGDIVVEDCDFIENGQGFGCGAGGLVQIEGSLSVSNCVFDGNYTDFNGRGSGIKAQSAEVQISDCLFRGNSASGQGGGIWVSDCSGNITGCAFIENIASSGAGLSAGGVSLALKVTSCLFLSNTAGSFGGGISGWPEIVNCTFFGNTAGTNSGGVHNGQEVSNCIFRLNMPNQLSDVFGLTVINSDIQGGWDGEGSGNININPQFMDIEFPYNLRLNSSSPCIDQGDNAAVLKGDDTDLDGNPRIVDGDGDGEATVDMGAYEFQGLPICPQDLDGDGNVGPIDLATLLGGWGSNPGHPADFDGDGVVGPIDLATLLGAWGPCE